METKEKLLLNLGKGKSVEARGDVCSFYGHREEKLQVRNKSTFKTNAPDKNKESCRSVLIKDQPLPKSNSPGEVVENVG